MQPDKQDIQRFWSKVQKLDYCWIWVGGVDKDRYGRFCVNGGYIRAHRFSFELSKNRIPEGFQIDHLCRNPSCVNPEHLEAVTPRINTLRSNNITAKNARKVRCIRGHELNEENTRIRKNGNGACRTCEKEAGKIRSNTEEYRKQRRLRYLKNKEVLANAS